MAKYTLIASRDPYESKETDHYFGLAGDLGRLADKVKASEIDIIVDHLAEGRKVVWH